MEAVVNETAKNVLGVDGEDEEEEQFERNLLNSTVYIISVMFQISTFAINYRGNPYMESLWENRSLLYSIAGSTAFVLALAMGMFPDLSDTFEIVQFTGEFRIILVQVLVADFVFSYVVDRVCLWLFGEGRLKVAR